MGWMGREGGGGVYSSPLPTKPLLVERRGAASRTTRRTTKFEQRARGSSLPKRLEPKWATETDCDCGHANTSAPSSMLC